MSARPYSILYGIIMNKEKKAILEMLLCASLWSIAGIFIKLIPWQPFAISGLRSLIAGLTILVYIRINKYRIIINKHTVGAGLAMGLLYTAFVLANKLTTAANAIVLQYTAPLFIVLISAVVYHTKIKRNDMLAVLGTFVGIALFFFDQMDSGKLLGNFVAIFAGVMMALMFMIVGASEGEEKFSGILFGQCTAFLIGLPVIISSKPEISALPVLYIVILGVLQLGVPYILFARASQHCPPLACSLLGAMEPLLNPVWVLIFDGEKPGFYALIGAIIVIASVTLWCAFGKEPEPKKKENHA